MAYMLQIFLLLVIAIAIYGKIDMDGDVLVLTDDNFDEAIATIDSILVEFYAPWCGHCKSLAPEWSKAAAALFKDGASTKLAKLDAIDNPKSASIHQIKGFPTIKYFRGGQYVSDYNGGRKESEIVAWARKKSAPAITTISSLEDLEKYEEANKVFVLGAFSSLQSEKAAIFAKIASQDDRVTYAYSDSPEVLSKYGVAADTAIVVKDFDEKRNDFAIGDDAEELVAFIIGHSVPLAETSKTIFASPITKHALFFTSKSQEDVHNNVIASMKVVAKSNRGRMLFVNVPSTETRITEFFGISEASLPALVIADMGGEAMKKYFYPGSLLSSDDVATYVTDFFSGSLRPSLKSQDVSPEDTAEPVVVVKGFSFDDLVLDNNKDVLIEFYAPWCGHCKKLAPVWDELGEKYENNPNIVIAKMDATSNEVDVPGLDVKGFPTIYFFKGNDKAHPVKYEGGRSVEDFVSFLGENAHNSVSHEEL